MATVSREWKPGDVAMVNDVTGADPETIAVCVTAGNTGDAHWRLMHERGGDVWSSVSKARPLAVIDPEDREAVERLMTCIPLRDRIEAVLRRSVDDDNFRRIGDHFQAALREFANPTPPRPEEPLGLGAVVLDAENWRWLSHRSGWRKWERTDGKRAEYADVAVVRVLSDGVQP